jgi:hypothetical protein
VNRYEERRAGAQAPESLDGSIRPEKIGWFGATVKKKIQTWQGKFGANGLSDWLA